MKLSIIITSYNYDRYLRASIDSALAVAYPDKEVIVVDDGSTDDSASIIKSYADGVIAIFTENGGEASASNVGFARSTGDIIIFLDSDDFVYPTIAEAVIAVWHDGVAKVQYPLRHVDGEGRPTGRVWPIYTTADTPDAVRKSVAKSGVYHAPPTTGNAWARSFLVALFPVPTGYADAIPRHGRSPFQYGNYTIYLDSYMNMLAPFFGDVVSLREPQAVYRNHDINKGYARFCLDEMMWVCQEEWDRAAMANAVLRDNRRAGRVNIEHYYRHMLHRLVYKRVAPHIYPFNDSVVSVCRKYCNAVARSDRELSRKFLLWMWGLVMTVLPRPLPNFMLRWSSLR